VPRADSNVHTHTPVFPGAFTAIVFLRCTILYDEGKGFSPGCIHRDRSEGCRMQPETWGSQ